MWKPAWIARRMVATGRSAIQARAASTTSHTYFGVAVYVSEARDQAVLRQLEQVARSTPGVCLANLFVDHPYNRTNYTLVGRSPHQLAAAAVALGRAALGAVDLRSHEATHPRLGAVDHISCHPLPAAGPGGTTGGGAAAAAAQAAAGAAGSAAAPSAAGAAGAAGGAAASTDAAPNGQQQQQQQQQQQVEQRQDDEAAAAVLAQAIAQQLGSGPPAVPVFTYGWAHPQERRLDDVRRQLGYFQGSASGSWQGALPSPGAAGEATSPAAAPAATAAAAAPGHAAAEAGQVASVPLPLPPCFGPAAAPARAGVCCVGAAPWIVNYNVVLLTQDLSAARAIARAVSARGGGLPGVQAMALRHTDGVEVACNLLDPARAPPAAVLAAVRAAAGERGLQVGAAYRTNKAPEELVAAAVAQGL